MIVAVTGADGRIGRILSERLSTQVTLRPVVRPRPGREMEGHAADLADRGALMDAFRGCDAVVHLAASARTDSSWEAVLRDNIVGWHTVLEAARLTAVRRVVFASSNHVVGMLETAGRVLDHDTPYRADSLYGVSKAFGEVLGRYYVDHHGLEVVCLRIGSVVAAPDPGPDVAGTDVWSVTPPAEQRRLRATWLSHRDCAGLVLAALTADVRWAVVFATSDNPRRIWDLDHAREAIGWVPVDAAPASPEAPIPGTGDP